MATPENVSNDSCQIFVVGIILEKVHSTLGFFVQHRAAQHQHETKITKWISISFSNQRSFYSLRKISFSMRSGTGKKDIKSVGQWWSLLFTDKVLAAIDNNSVVA